MTGTLLTTWFVLCGTIAPQGTIDEDRSTRDALARAMSVKLTFRSTMKRKNPVRVAHCRRAADGCDARLEALAEYFVLVGHDLDIDPWILAAMAFRESGFNPYAVGSLGERGILQIHPHNKHASGLKWLRDARHRERCRREPGACQLPVVKTAASILSKAIETCGDLESGLAAYRSGECRSESSYARRVARTRKELLELGCPGTSPLVDDPEGMPTPTACQPDDETA